MSAVEHSSVLHSAEVFEAGGGTVTEVPVSRAGTATPEAYGAALRPDTILVSVLNTNRAVIVEEGWPHGGVGANLATLITEQAFDHLDAPVQRVTGADVHMPYSKRLEQAAIPHEEHVVKAALAALEGSI